MVDRDGAAASSASGVVCFGTVVTAASAGLSRSCKSSHGIITSRSRSRRPLSPPMPPPRWGQEVAPPPSPFFVSPNTSPPHQQQHQSRQPQLQQQQTTTWDEQQQQWQSNRHRCGQVHHVSRRRRERKPGLQEERAGVSVGAAASPSSTTDRGSCSSSSSSTVPELGQQLITYSYRFSQRDHEHVYRDELLLLPQQQQQQQQLLSRPPSEHPDFPLPPRNLPNSQTSFSSAHPGSSPEQVFFHPSSPPVSPVVEDYRPKSLILVTRKQRSVQSALLIPSRDGRSNSAGLTVRGGGGGCHYSEMGRLMEEEEDSSIVAVLADAAAAASSSSSSSVSRFKKKRSVQWVSDCKTNSKDISCDRKMVKNQVQQRICIKAISLKGFFFQVTFKWNQ